MIVEITNHLISTWGVNFKLRTIAGKALGAFISLQSLSLRFCSASVCLFVCS